MSRHKELALEERVATRDRRDEKISAHYKVRLVSRQSGRTDHDVVVAKISLFLSEAPRALVCLVTGDATDES